MLAVAVLTGFMAGCATSHDVGSRSSVAPHEGGRGHAPISEAHPLPMAPEEQPVRLAIADASTSTPQASPLREPAPAEALRSTEERIGDCSSEEEAARWARQKGRYSPPGNVYPAIIQGEEYGPIEAIQAFYAQVREASAPRFGEFHVEVNAELSSGGTGITVSGQRGPVTIELSPSRVRIGHRSFSDSKTISLFQTLGRILSDLGAQCRYRGIRGSRLRTRGYKDFVRIEFSYGSVVVHLEAASSGPGDAERLYVLDLQQAKDSLLWAHEEGASAQ